MFRHVMIAGALLFFTGTAMADEFRLRSTDVAEGKELASAQVFNGLGCDGGNTSPQLSWQNAPAGTKSFAVTAYDPDAPTGSGFWHWVVFNIPASVTKLDGGAGSGKGLPAGAVQSRTDFGAPGFGGACPPPGAVHRYIFKVTALKVEALDLPVETSAAMVGFMTNANALGSASITAVYTK
ncbi:YbhB/YbcL family Raf kinase inhibitor-like protein [Pleomorphomonas sp. PLEO]|uniref:YbhB/YbcL family Raf kinase inhibitor-like protein n=1 Tax=Pleomorphomonas sp. PLEO TaxID=3239306 RepID=UPI00351DFE60